ncbi:MAG: S8 family serine peptidase [Anaerolineae bacterium]|nr:S8 family serine peptidase [Anaerolineae bacterium]
MNPQAIRKIANLFIVCVLSMGTLVSSMAAASPMVSVIVRSSSVDDATAAVHSHNGQVIADIDLIDAVVARVPQNRVDLLNDMAGVSVTLDFPVQSAGAQVDVEFAKNIGLSEVWEAGVLGEGITVAMMDSGVDPSFNGLRIGPDGGNDRLLAYYDAINDELYEPNHLMQSPGDPNGHGTHIAGIIGNSFYEQQDDEYRGVAPAANLVAVRVLNEYGEGAYSDVLRGLDWVVDNKDTYDIRVLNISMYALPVAPYWVDPYNLAVMAAWEAGIVVVASAGNAGPDPMTIGVPGNTPYIITVGTFTDHYTPADFSDDYIPPFSAAGPTFDAFIKPDVIAPGAHMVSLMPRNAQLNDLYPDNRLNGRYFTSSGTSTSAAVVSGLVALMLSEDPDLTPDEVKYRLMNTARPQFDEETGTAAYSIWQQGAGRVWAPDAVFTDMEGAANAGMDISLDLAGVEHYWGWTVYDTDAEEFTVNGYTSWSDGYTSWSGGYTSWSDGYTSWSDLTNWAGSFFTWADAYTSWSDGYTSWSGGYTSWSDGYTSWSDGYTSWSDAYTSWSGGFTSWSDGLTSWSDGFTSWSDGLTSWSGGLTSWSDGWTSWSDGWTSWSDGYTTWSGGYTTWSGGYTTWSGGYMSWAGGLPGVDW